jgi:hypothetical protein
MRVVEPDGARGKRQRLPGEILFLREERKSAEAVVATRPPEKGAERRKASGSDLYY